MASTTKWKKGDRVYPIRFDIGDDGNGYGTVVDVDKDGNLIVSFPGEGDITHTYHMSGTNEKPLYKTREGVLKAREKGGFIKDPFGDYRKIEAKVESEAQKLQKEMNDLAREAYKKKIEDLKEIKASRDSIQKEIDKFKKSSSGVKTPRRGSGKITHVGDGSYVNGSYVSPENLSSGKITFVPMILDKSNGDHKYKFAGTNASKFRKAYDESSIMSVTSLGGLISGDEIKKMEKKLKELQEIEKLTPKQVIERDSLSKKLFKIHSAGDYGTTFHRAVERIEKEKLDISDDSIAKKLIRELIDSEKMKLGSKSEKDLIKDVGAYFKWKKENNMSDVIGSELSLGGALKIGGKTRLIGGTLDQLFQTGNYGVRDLKATSGVDPKYGFQLSMLAKLVREAGFDVPSGLGITRVSSGNVYNEEYKELSDKIIVDLLTKAYEIVEAQTPEIALEAQKRAREILGGGGRYVKLGEEEYGGIKYTTYNGVSLRKTGKMYKNETDPSRALQKVKELYDSIKDDPQASAKFFASLYNMKTSKDGDSSGFYLSGPVWDLARKQISNPYNMPVKNGAFETKEFSLDDGSMASGTTFGGLFASQTIKRYKMTLMESGEEAARAYVDSILTKIDETMGNGNKDFAGMIEAKLAEKFYNSLIEQSGVFDDITLQKRKMFNNISKADRKYLMAFESAQKSGRLGDSQELSKLEELLKRAFFSSNPHDYKRWTSLSQEDKEKSLEKYRQDISFRYHTHQNDTLDNRQNIISYIERYNAKDIGGEGQLASKEEQELSSLLSSKNRMRQTIDFMNSFIERMNVIGQGGFGDVFSEIKKDSESGMGLDVIIEKYRNKLQGLFKGLSFIKEEFANAINNLGRESELDQFGEQENINLSDDIIDNIVRFRSKLIAYVKKSGLPKDLDAYIIKNIEKNITPIKSDGAEMAAWRVSRGIGASDYIEKVLQSSMDAGNSVGKEIDPSEYVKNLLSKEGFYQYSDSQVFKKKFLDYAAIPGGISEFLGEFASSNSNEWSFESTEMNQLKDSLKRLVSVYGKEILDTIGDQIIHILYNDSGEFDLSKRFESFERGGARNSILSGRGIGYYSSQGEPNANGGVEIPSMTMQELAFIEKEKELLNDDSLSSEERGKILTKFLKDAFFSYLPKAKDVFGKWSDKEKLSAFIDYKNELIYHRYPLYQRRLNMANQIGAARIQMGSELDEKTISAQPGMQFMTGYFQNNPRQLWTYKIDKEKLQKSNDGDKASQYKDGDVIKDENGASFVISKLSDKTFPFYIDKEKRFANIDDYKIFGESSKSSDITDMNISAQNINISSPNTDITSEKTDVNDEENVGGNMPPAGSDGNGGGSGSNNYSDDERIGGSVSKAQKIYNEYLKEEIKLQKEIDKITEDINRKKKEGIDDPDAKKQRTRLRRAKTSINRQAKKEISGMFGEDVWAEVSGSDETKAVLRGGDRERAFQKKEMATAQPNKILQDYNKYLNERLSLEDKIYKSQLKANTTVGKERLAYEQVVALLAQKLGMLDEQNKDLEIAAQKVDKGAAKQIKDNYNLELAQKYAEREAGNRGQRTLRDVMKRDIEMVGMRFMNWGLVSRLISKLPQSLNRVKQTTQQLEQALMNLRVVTGYNREEGEALMVTYNKLSKQLGSTTVEVANAADAWLRQGYSVADAENLITASMKLSKLGKIDSAQATKNLTSALHGYKLEATSAISVVDKLTKVDMEAAVSAGDIAEGLARVATSAQLAGLSMDETIGILSTIGEVTQRDMGSVGDALRTMLSRYGNVKAGVFTQMGLDDDGETSENINDIEKVLGKLGIRIRSSSLEMRDISDVLDDVAAKWNTLDSVSRNALSTAFAGVRQRE